MVQGLLASLLQQQSTPGGMGLLFSSNGGEQQPCHDAIVRRDPSASEVPIGSTSPLHMPPLAKQPLRREAPHGALQPGSSRIPWHALLWQNSN